MGVAYKNCYCYLKALTVIFQAIVVSRFLRTASLVWSFITGWHWSY